MTKPSAGALNATQVYLLTLLAMIAFAGNSLLCRVALKDTAIAALLGTLAGAEPQGSLPGRLRFGY